MIDTVLIDSGPLIALFDKDDKYHAKILNFLKSKKHRLLTTIAVITEVLHMLDFNKKVQIDFLDWVARGGVILYEISQNDLGRILELMKKYVDLPMDFADATLIVAAEKRNIKEIISIDSDFNVYRLLRKEKMMNIFANPTEE